jgi:transcriptional regulator
MARVDAVGFVDAWVSVYEQGGSQGDVAKMIGTSSANVSTRAKKLREAGVDLPTLTVTRGVKATIDVAALNERLKARMVSA